MLKFAFILLSIICINRYVNGDKCNGNHCPKTDEIPVPCPREDDLCSTDRLGFEAVVQLHKHMDDDHNGNLDRSESVGFIRDELEHTKDGGVLQSAFHGSDDLISVNDLWKLWSRSSVYNWSTSEIVDWLNIHVDLAQYGHAFRINGVDGKTLPRMAIPNGQFTARVLGIKNIVHKKKLALKAMDIVMFGPPKGHSFKKDIALLITILIATGVCWYAYTQNQCSQQQMNKVMKDMEGLQNLEDNLSTLNQRLNNEKKDHKKVLRETEANENKLRKEMEQAKDKAEQLSKQREHTEEEISRLRLAEEELVEVRRALRRAEHAKDEHGHAPILQLQCWLQLSYEIESQYFEAKKEAAKAELRNAIASCDKMHKKRNAFLGSLRIAHSASFDDTDRKVMNARLSLSNVKCELTERTKRWNEIENICGYTITQNAGIHPLAKQLEQHLPSMSTFNSTSNLSGLSAMSSSISGSMAKFTDSDTDNDNSSDFTVKSNKGISGTYSFKNSKGVNGSFSSTSS